MAAGPRPSAFLPAVVPAALLSLLLPACGDDGDPSGPGTVDRPVGSFAVTVSGDREASAEAEEGAVVVADQTRFGGLSTWTLALDAPAGEAGRSVGIEVIFDGRGETPSPGRLEFSGECATLDVANPVGLVLLMRVTGELDVGFCVESGSLTFSEASGGIFGGSFDVEAREEDFDGGGGGAEPLRVRVTGEFRASTFEGFDVVPEERLPAPLLR